MKTTTLPTPEVLPAAAAALNEALRSLKGQSFLFLVSGGSALALLDHLDPENFGRSSTVSMFDERFSLEPQISNFSQLMAHPLSAALTARGTRFLDTRPTPGESLSAWAARLEENLHQARHANWKIIASAGIGPDAHTGGIMPFPENPTFFEHNFDKTDHELTAYDAGDKNPLPKRLTITMPLIRQIDTAVIYAVGANKETALRKLMAETGALAESPCRIWREVPGATLYTDVINS